MLYDADRVRAELEKRWRWLPYRWKLLDRLAFPSQGLQRLIVNESDSIYERGFHVFVAFTFFVVRVVLLLLLPGRAQIFEHS